jgi:cation-transporting ATPase E
MNHELQGLTQEEVRARRARGLGNEVTAGTGRTYLQIVRKNAFTFVNTVLFGIGIVLVVMGQFGDALVTAGLVLLNVIVGVYQEARAKRKLEQIALLTRPRATVIRDGREQEIDPAQIVQGDLLRVRPGDQIVADGRVAGGGRMEVDESLLTGESERVAKEAGDEVYSGSFCVTGGALYEAQKVGADSLVNRLTAGARAFRQVKTPLQRDVNFIIRVLVLLVTPLGALLAISFVLNQVPLVEGVRVAAVIVALVPQGLFFMTTVAYAMGAVRVAGRGALIQESNSVESLSHVDLLCLDKTGTLTSNRLDLHEVLPLEGGDEDGLRRLLGDYAASAAGGNRTTAAIQAGCGGQARPVRAEVAFSSEHKWSALAFDGAGDRPGVYVLGAPEVLAAGLAPDPAREAEVEVRARQGLRVLLLAHGPGDGPLHDGQGAPRLPEGLAPLGLLSLRDELRPEAGTTLSHLSGLGIELKVISGDNPQTVAALARQVGLPGIEDPVSGLDLAGLEGAQLAEMADGPAIFGRITPQQKEALVQAFRQRGRYVAMIGDGVNDVLSLKQAQVGVSMESGSQATRSVADIVLLGDSFAALPAAFREGQRIVQGMEDVVRLLLTRTFYVLFLVIATRLAGAPFPVTPKHNSILALLTVGIPILAIAAWARPGRAADSVIQSTRHFIFSAALSIAVVTLGVYLFYLAATDDVAVARTALTTASVLCGLVLIPFVEPPTEFWVGGDALSGDRRPALLAGAMLVLYGLVVALPPLRDFFELVPLRAIDYAALAAVVAAWALALRFAWRAQLLERILSSTP